MIVGVPSNDFGGRSRWRRGHHQNRPWQYGIVSLTAKTQVKDATPIPTSGRRERPRDARWNFHKFLIVRRPYRGRVPTDVEPMDARVINAILKKFPRAE